MRIEPILLSLAVLALPFVAHAAPDSVRVKVEGGTIEGRLDEETAVRHFRGIPFAAPPVGPLRWKGPKPVVPWTGVRPAKEFGARPMQLPVYGDMKPRATTMSEDCLTLNVWTPANPSPEAKRGFPVLVYFYGGGFAAGDASEPRYDGETMARHGIVTITVNYRLGIFGFLAHPELVKESAKGAAGNYGLMDQAAAIRWVRNNVGAFGGDPRRITIAGESAGSFSVSAQMASPLSRDLIAGAIGESGAFFGSTLGMTPLEDAARDGAAFAAEIKAPTLAELRALPAEQLLQATRPNPFRFRACIDGEFLPKSVPAIYAAGEQARVPLLAGWNAEESGANGVLGNEPWSLEAFTSAVRRLYPDRADEVLKVYPATAKQSAVDLASDRFIGYGTWKWTDLHAATSGRPVYRYLFARARPGEGGAVHAGEIEYALGNLDRNDAYKWTDDDRTVSATMVDYFVRFIWNGDPNGPNLPRWLPNRKEGITSVMRLDVTSRSMSDTTSPRYRLLDRIAGGK